jgi:hypothetical protein
MGCGESKQIKKSKNLENQPKLISRIKFNRNSNLDPKDYVLKDIIGQEIIRKPDTIKGQQMCLDGINKSQIFLLDHIASMLIDEVVNSTVVTGPIESSAFIRGSSSSIFIIACQQLRLRDCQNLRILLYSQTRPIIENCTNITFGCYDYDYFGFESHLEDSKLDIWINKWESVYDYTPNNRQNFKIMPYSVSSLTLLQPYVLEKLSIDGLSPLVSNSDTKQSKRSGLIRTSGVQNIPKGDNVLSIIVSFPTKNNYVSIVRDLAGIFNSTEIFAIRTNKLSLNNKQIRILKDDKKYGKNKDPPIDYISVQIAGSKESIEEAIDFLANNLPHNDIAVVSDSNKIKELSELIFEKWEPPDN